MGYDTAREAHLAAQSSEAAPIRPRDLQTMRVIAWTAFAMALVWIGYRGAWAASHWREVTASPASMILELFTLAAPPVFAILVAACARALAEAQANSFEARDAARRIRIFESRASQGADGFPAGAIIEQLSDTISALHGDIDNASSRMERLDGELRARMGVLAATAQTIRDGADEAGKLLDRQAERLGEQAETLAVRLSDLSARLGAMLDESGQAQARFHDGWRSFDDQFQARLASLTRSAAIAEAAMTKLDATEAAADERAGRIEAALKEQETAIGTAAQSLSERAETIGGQFRSSLTAIAAVYEGLIGKEKALDDAARERMTYFEETTQKSLERLVALAEGVKSAGREAAASAERQAETLQRRLESLDDAIEDIDRRAMRALERHAAQVLERAGQFVDAAARAAPGGPAAMEAKAESEPSADADESRALAEDADQDVFAGLRAADGETPAPMRDGWGWSDMIQTIDAQRAAGPPATGDAPRALEGSDETKGRDRTAETDGAGGDPAWTHFGAPLHAMLMAASPDRLDLLNGDPGDGDLVDRLAALLADRRDVRTLADAYLEARRAEQAPGQSLSNFAAVIERALEAVGDAEGAQSGAHDDGRDTPPAFLRS